MRLSVSKRTLTRLIADKKIEARKSGPRTLVDVASLKAYASFSHRPARQGECFLLRILSRTQLL